MNKERRKQLAEIVAQLEDLAERIELLSADELEALENLPQGFQDGARGQMMQAAIDAMDEAKDAVDDAVAKLIEAAE